MKLGSSLDQAWIKLGPSLDQALIKLGLSLDQALFDNVRRLFDASRTGHLSNKSLFDKPAVKQIFEPVKQSNKLKMRSAKRKITLIPACVIPSLGFLKLRPPRACPCLLISVLLEGM